MIKHNRKFLYALGLAHLLFLCWPQVGSGEEPLGYGLTPVYGKPASPPLSLQGHDGERYSLSDFRESVVLVNFWATWCPPCVREMPTLQKMRSMLSDQPFEVLAVNLGEGQDTIERFIAKMNPPLEFPILLATDEAIMQEWKIQGLPSTFIIAPGGELVYQAVGPRDFSHEHVIARIKDLISN